MAKNNSNLVVFAALAANVGIAVAKGVASALTGSTAMLTEAIHSLVDTGNQGLLLWGMRRSSRPPSEDHPFGHGMEIYFWSFIVALMVFTVGGAVSIYEGVDKLRHPGEVGRPLLNFVVIGVAALMEGTSFAIAWREFAKVRGDTPFLTALHRSKDPSMFAVLLEDGAALVGLAIAALGVAGGAYLDLPWADGVASIGIGVLLCGVALFMASETRSLLTGEAAAPRLVGRIRTMLADEPRIDRVLEVLSMHLGPNEILLALTLDFRDDLRTDEIEGLAESLADRLRAIDSRINRVFVRSGRGKAAYDE